MATTVSYYRTVIRVSLPLVVSTSTTMVMEFTDRVFLARYSLDAIAAALPAGITALVFISFFAGISGYLNVFIAQFEGAGRKNEVGGAVWQGIYFSLAAALLLAMLYFPAAALFRWIGHPSEIQVLETTYFRVLCLGAGIHILGMTFSCFFTGRGDTRPVMMIHLVGAVFNIPLDYAMINGKWGLPEMGIFGAGLATVASWTLVTGLFAAAMFRRKLDRVYLVGKRHGPDLAVMVRLLRYGVPGALQFCLDILGFAFFVLVVGRLGAGDLALSNIVLSINSIAYMPMMGMSLGTSTLVGMALGRRDPREAVELTRSTIHLILMYIFFLGVLFLLLPENLLAFFRPASMPPEAVAEMNQKGSMLLIIVTAYIFFDALYMVFVGVLKGAGDTPFIMKSIGTLSVFAMGLPLWIGVEFFHGGLFFAWGCLAFFVFSLFTVSAFRYRQGRWKRMLVIGRTAMESAP